MATIDEKIEQAAQYLLDSAVEIQETDRDFASDFEAFGRVLWNDDEDMNKRGLTREQYKEALLQAWRAFNTD